MAIDYRTHRDPGPLVQLPAGSTFTRAGDGIGIGIDHKGRVIASKPGEIVEWGKRRVENLTPWDITTWPRPLDVAAVGDDWYSVAKLVSAGSEPAQSPPVLLSGIAHLGVLVEFRAGTSDSVDIGIFLNTPSGWPAVYSGEIVSGPGVASSPTGRLRITGLSSSESTIVRFRAEGFGASESAAIYIYPGTSGSTTVGDSILIRRPQLEARRDYSYPVSQVSLGVLPAPYHGWNVDGVEYFNTDENGDPIPEATMKGMIIASGQTNVVRSASDLTQSAWTKRGAISVTAASDPVMGGPYTQVRDAGAGGVDDVHGGRVSGLVPGSTFSLSFVMRAISASGTIRVANSSGGPMGNWGIDLSLVGDGDLITASHPAVTEFSAFTATPTGALNLHFYALDGATLDFDISMITLVEGTEPALPIPNPSDTDPATRPTESLMINVPGGVLYEIDATYGDGSKDTITRPAAGEGGITLTADDFSRETIAALQSWAFPMRASITPRRRGATIRRMR